MQYKRLGRSGLDVSRICLGAMMFGGRADEREAEAIILNAKEKGVNFIDTADSYNGGRSEEIVGRAIAGARANWVLATKAGNPMGDDRNRRGLGRRWLSMACEESLKRLKTDWIDLLYLHLEDHATPLEESVGTVATLLNAGKIRYFGVSNFRAWRIAEICNLCDRLGAPRPVACQPYYNALNRMPEVEVLPACSFYGLGVVPYNPLARGILTGKYKPAEAPPAGSRAADADPRMLETEWRPESIKIAQRLQAHPSSRGATAVAFAVAWLLANRLVTSVLAGPRTAEQFASYFEGLDYPFNREDEQLLDSLVASGHPSTPGYSDPRYPIEGRIPRFLGEMSLPSGRIA